MLLHKALRLYLPDCTTGATVAVSTQCLPSVGRRVARPALTGPSDGTLMTPSFAHVLRFPPLHDWPVGSEGT